MTKSGWATLTAGAASSQESESSLELMADPQFGVTQMLVPDPRFSEVHANSGRRSTVSSTGSIDTMYSAESCDRSKERPEFGPIRSRRWAGAV